MKSPRLAIPSPTPCPCDTPAAATSTSGYPLSWPLAYSAAASVYRLGEKLLNPPPNDIIWCGDAMPHGGIRTITIRYADWATDEYLLTWMELTMADGALATLFPGRLTLSPLRVYARVWTLHS